jgi:hypothetical protein
MSKEAEYRKHAASLLDLAKRSTNSHDKNRLLAFGGVAEACRQAFAPGATAQHNRAAFSADLQ